MYSSMYPAMGAVPMCYYCVMTNRPIMQPVASMESKSMMRGEEEFEENRIDKGSAAQPMPPMGKKMPGMMDMSKMDMGKIKADAQEIVKMLEQHHPDMINTLTACGMSIGQARQYLSRVVEMSLMHHMMHQM